MEEGPPTTHRGFAGSPPVGDGPVPFGLSVPALASFLGVMHHRVAAAPVAAFAKELRDGEGGATSEHREGIAAAGRMRGRTVLVTGSTDGVGRQTAVELARLGAIVLVHGRDHERGAAALADVQEALSANGQSPDEAGLFLEDLSTMRGVRALAARVRHCCPRLDVLVNNAAVYSPERIVTADGLELTFAVNVVAPFLLTRELLPLLDAAAPSRVVNLSSTSHWQGVMQWDDLQLEHGYTGLVAYEQSKLALSLLTFELARRLQRKHIAVTCLDPGNVDTAMLRAGWPELAGIDVAAGSATSVRLASAPELDGITGVYYELGRETVPSASSIDREAQRRLWTILESITGGQKA